MTTNTNSAQERTASIDLDKQEQLERYGTGVLPWSCRISSNQPANVIADAMQAELNDLRPLVAAARRSLTSGAPAEPFGMYVERADGTAEFQRTGKAFQPTAQGYKFWTLYAAPVHDAAAPSNDTTDEAARLRKVLIDVRHALQFANDNPGGGINDTIWMMHSPETLFDFIDTSLSAGAAAKTELLERVRDAVADSLTGLYHCGRVWSAWGYGTMSQDDFSPAEEDDDIIENITSAAIAAISAGAAAKTEQAERKVQTITVFFDDEITFDRSSGFDEQRIVWNPEKQQTIQPEESNLWELLEEITDAADVFLKGGCSRLGPLIEKSRASLADRATAAGAGSAQPRAEGDERALFKAWQKKQDGGRSNQAEDWEVWQARAALDQGAQAVTTASVSEDVLPIGYVTPNALNQIAEMGSDFPTFRNIMVRNKPSRDAVMPIYGRSPAPNRDAGQEEASTQTVPSIDTSEFREMLRDYRGAIGLIVAMQKLNKIIAYIDGRTAGTRGIGSDGAAGTVEKDAALLASKRFLEDMHMMPIDWTINESQILHAQVSAAIEAHNKAGKEQG